jgi:DNA-directed RNA polymerase specialized sigma54-like protein
MTPQLTQAIKLLQLSSLDLATYVEGELERCGGQCPTRAAHNR